MAEIFPFAAYRYNPARVPFERVLTQPYDKITPAMQDKYSAADPHNLIAIEKGRSLPGDTPENNVYTRAAQALEEWVAKGFLVRDPAPSLYVSEQEYDLPGTTERRVRRGVVALSRIEDYAAGVVFRHEQTLAGPKADRLELLRHTRVHTGQLFMLYADPERAVDALAGEVSKTPPAMNIRDEYGVAHRLWVISDATRIARLQRLLADKKLVIADGHHRYETALAYRDECRARLGAADRDAPHERVMMTLVNAHSEGLTILPTHRVVTNLKGFQLKDFFGKLQPYFGIGPHPFQHARERLQAYEAFRGHFADAARRDGLRQIGVYAGSDRSWSGEQAFFVLTLKPEANLAALLPQVSPAQRTLDVVLLHRLILERGLGISPDDVVLEKNIRYEREMDAAIAAVDRGAAQACFVLNPVEVGQVVKMATAGEVLPQKSTDFYPKLLSGVTIYKL
ncbi:MAG TPA: DUF1015 domain-containing protein [Candidatus Acidoferrales bacterium]|nr:DUF1015 domain-containing protein [Candidatus Acidoferrales bacterium]